MITNGVRVVKKLYLSRRESIILSAIEIINELGTQGLTIRELSSRQGVTEAAIYKHFKSKTEIILGVLDKFAQFDDRIEAVIKEQNMNVKDGILFLVGSYAEYYENYPALSAILFVFDTLRGEPESAEKMKNIFNGRFKFISSLVEEGQEKGHITKEIETEQLADMVTGMMESAVFRWRMNNYGFPLKNTITNAVEALLRRC
jgi:AcrR family transcriptional regulator